MNFIKNNIDQINQDFQDKDAIEVLKWANETFENRIVLASSLGLEDQVLTDMLFKINPEFNIFFLDTGRIHQETYDVLEKTMNKYGIKYDIYYPNTKNIEYYTKEHGINAFYKSIELRKKCCEIRKIEPLKRAISGFEAWITGLRRDQSITRSAVNKIEWDNDNNKIKINPLTDWTTEQIWSYIKKYNVPYNILHDRGFPSIGCAPCSRPISANEDIRAGRWWWEAPKTRECGLHKHK